MKDQNSMSSSRPALTLSERLRAPSILDTRADHIDRMRMAADEIDRLKAELSRAHAGLREVEEWDCRGDTLKEAYDSRKGAGAWDGLFPTP